MKTFKITFVKTTETTIQAENLKQACEQAQLLAKKKGKEYKVISVIELN